MIKLYSIVTIPNKAKRNSKLEYARKANRADVVKAAREVIEKTKTVDSLSGSI